MKTKRKREKRVQAYMRRDIRAMARCRICESALWMYRRWLARRGWTDKQLRGKSARDLARIYANLP